MGKFRICRVDRSGEWRSKEALAHPLPRSVFRRFCHCVPSRPTPLFLCIKRFSTPPPGQIERNVIPRRRAGRRRGSICSRRRLRRPRRRRHGYISYASSRGNRGGEGDARGLLETTYTRKFKEILT